MNDEKETFTLILFLPGVAQPVVIPIESVDAGEVIISKQPIVIRLDGLSYGGRIISSKGLNNGYGARN